MAVKRDGRRDGTRLPLRVLMVNTVPMSYTGITMVMLNYAAHLDREKVRVDFVATNQVEESLRRRIEEMGCGLYQIPGRNRRPLRYLARLAALIRRNGYPVVHAHGNSCTLAIEMLAARLGGARVRCAHSHNTRALAMRAHRLLRPLFERCVTHGFACGADAGRWLFRERPFEVLNNGVDAARFAFNPEGRAAWREKLGIGDRIAIGHVGSFNRQKNHAFLVDAFARVAAADPRRALVLVGGGPLEEEVRRQVRKKGLEGSVIFVGVTQDIPGLLSAMDLMVLPSLYEGLPNVLVEWQASGLPALVADTVTREARLTDLVEFLPLDEGRWADAMVAAVPPKDRAGASAAVAEEIRAAGYDIRDSAARLEGLYARYLAAAEAPARSRVKN